MRGEGNGSVPGGFRVQSLLHGEQHPWYKIMVMVARVSEGGECILVVTCTVGVSVWVTHEVQFVRVNARIVMKTVFWGSVGRGSPCA